MKIYQVGGSIRDRLLGLPVTDRDWLVVGATPEEMIKQGYRPVGRDFPVFLHPETHEEYALARTERKTAPGYRGFVFNTSTEVSIEDDLSRRDLTINAIAEDIDGNLIDPHGGRNDLEAGLLRHISPAFAEDPLRILRVARFAARFDFTIAADTMILMREISASGELSTLAPERVWTETEKALGSEHPVRYFETLRECDALSQVYPELDRLYGIPQPENYHPEIDTGIHTMMVLEQSVRLTKDPMIRFAALVHDLGKGMTPANILPSHRGHEERGVKIIRDLCKRMKVPNRYRDLAVIVSRYHFICHKIDELRADTIVRKLEAMDAFRNPERFEAFLIACEADARGRTGFEDEAYPQADWFRAYHAAAAAIDMNAILGLGLEGQAIGAAIHQSRINAIISAQAKYRGDRQA